MSFADIIKKTTSEKEVKQFFSYFCVGGSAAIVEWMLFTIFANVIGINYLIATCAAFVFSTATNWLLGRIWTFRESNAYKGRAAFEAVLVFMVSGVGLIFNLGLMYFFVTMMKLNSPIQKTASKIVSTGIVFIWNYLIRKLLIYRDEKYTTRRENH